MEMNVSSSQPSQFNMNDLNSMCRSCAICYMPFEFYFTFEDKFHAVQMQDRCKCGKEMGILLTGGYTVTPPSYGFQ